jgi:hypothetical protein
MIQGSNAIKKEVKSTGEEFCILFQGATNVSLFVVGRLKKGIEEDKESR